MAMNIINMMFLKLILCIRSTNFGEDFVKNKYNPHGIIKSNTWKNASWKSVGICNVFATGSHTNVQNSKFKIIENAGHEANIDNPIELASTIYDFWKDNEKAIR